MDANADEAMDIAREGHRAYERGDYDEARRLFQIAADQDNTWAQSWLGFMHEEGRGVEKDHAEACRLYRLAADQGYAWAQCSLGIMHKEGRGVEQDYAEACRLFRMAADQGDPRAQSWLGFMYEEGRGVEKSDAEAYRWYRKAAGQGYAWAKRKLRGSVEKLRELGIKYEFGHGVEKNTLKARYFWLFGGSCGLTPRRIASQQRTHVPHSATGDSRKDALWGCHSHGKAHFACGPHQRAHSACGRSRRVRLSVRARAQNALFREGPRAECAFP